MTPIALLAAASALLAAAQPAGAQVHSTLMLGTGIDSATATSSAGAWAFRPTLRLGSDLAGGGVDGHVAGLLDGGWTGEVRATGHARLDLGRSLSLTTTVGGEVGRLADAVTLRRGGAAARLDAAVGSFGGWLRLGVERAEGIGSSTPVVAVGAGSALDVGALRFSVSSTANRYLHLAFTTSSPGGDSVVVLTTESRPRTYMQGEVAVDWAHRLLRVQVAVGARFAQTEGSGEAWARAAAEVPIDRRLSVVGAFGKYPGVPEQGLDGRHFARAGLRVRLPAPGEPSARPTGVADGTLFAVAAGRAHLIRVVARGADVVEITGDLTDWSPLLLDRSEDGVWETALVLRPGFYRVAVRIDGGAWTPPAGVPSVPDEFGGRVGALVVD